MLYALLKPLVTVALRLYFRRIKCNGLENIDNNRPTLILANHTASFMDAILVACFVKRRIHFFARGDVFGNRMADKILRSIGLLPVYRLSEGRDKLHLNDSSNDEALKILAKGGAVLIFCEGISDVAKRLKPMKKGPFRLAANAAATLAHAPEIVPLGINYITPAHPGGDVFLEGAASISTKTFLDGKDESSLAKAATSLMRQTAAYLAKLSWHTLRQEDEPLVDNALLAMQNSGRNYSFESTQLLVERINNADEASRKQMAETIAVHRKPALQSGQILQLVLLAPFAAVGWLFHLPVVAIAHMITKAKVKSADFIAPVYLSCILLLMMAWYLVIAILMAIFWDAVLWLPALFAIACCGFLYLKIYRRLSRI